MVQRLLIIILLLGSVSLRAQQIPLRQYGQQGTGGSNVTYDNQGRPIRKSKGSDSLQHRDRYADSITIYYRYYDSTRNRIIDSSINDFTIRFPLPYYYHTLGNYGTAAQSMLFNPYMKPGFDAGFHQYDIYAYTVENTRFYQTTRPYTELAYLLGSKAEQLVNLSHTQNRKSNFNFSFEYRFSNEPGVLKTQNASHNNIRFTAHYQTRNKKYEYFLIYISNKAASSENGGLRDVKKLDSLALNDPYELETRLGIAGAATRNPFNTSVVTGNIYKNTTLLFRHHFDLGKKDSLVTDSVTYKLFYPRLRVEHTLNYTTSSYEFLDQNADSTTYRKYFNIRLPKSGVVIDIKDQWKSLINEFSLLSFPDKNNQSQYLKAGIALQNLRGTFDTITTRSYYNVYATGEYRNRTRNQVWDIEANGQLYLNGFNAGDYAAFVSMKRSLGKKLGYFNIGFQNVNRSPSFLVTDTVSHFWVANRGHFNKENVIRLFAQYENPRSALRLGAEYFAVTNYLYFDSFMLARQEPALFNVLHLSLEKRIRLSRHWNWYTEVHLQQTTGQPPVNLPLILTRNRIAFEGNFYTNLFLSTGLELRYNTPYKADNYSPFIGQYFYQRTESISNRLDINAFLHFRIKSFKGFVRLENLNTLNLEKGFQFSKLNFVSGVYPNTGLWTRVGIWWNFVN
ncbi:Putative porin [Hydrobacter penzbergensis]|uniref:Porin n=1 Tax=Hydrobacter penzbergensis TaxID=1235997 RepID=A0A8X8IG73_9BACT|nr:putative porin [Hydrobacter penzbergensis]SDX68031.1 Putative porin [Hydrobacter penzbergensis]